MKAWRERHVCVVAFLDLSRAYDRAWRQAVIYKLLRCGLRGRMLAWIHNFLQQRVGVVSLCGARSSTRRYEYGLPQGSCLSPILFNVFLKDMFRHNYVSASRDVGIFADDVRVACYASTIMRASSILTKTLDSVEKFAARWRLSFDLQSKKCGSMTFSLVRQKYDEMVFFGQAALSHLKEYKHLGVIFDPRMTFKSHIKRVRQKAWGAFHRIRKYTSRFWGASLKIMILLYRAYVQPVLESACAVWCLASESTLKTLTPIHTAALRAAVGAKSSTSREALNVYCGVWSLEMWREYLCSRAFLRIKRLLVNHHPIAKSHEE